MYHTFLCTCLAFSLGSSATDAVSQHKHNTTPPSLTPPTPNRTRLQIAQVDHPHLTRQGHSEVGSAHVHLRGADVHRGLLNLRPNGDVLAAEGHAPPVGALQQRPRGGPKPLR